jgi:hypothetical protein
LIAPRAAAFSHRVARAAGFLVHQQSPDGAWRDFLLPPGRSDAWVTAYTGTRLLSASPGDFVDAKPALKAAVRFIEGARARRGGWGYNARCAPDADSTAQAILFLRAAGGTPTLRDYAALARFQLRDGSFATYMRDEAAGGWCRGHPDVTAVALQALAAILEPNHVILRRGRARMEAFVARRDATASYWWPSPFYLARELLVLAGCSRIEVSVTALDRERLPAGGCFEMALAAEVALRGGDGMDRAERLARELCAAQLNDGSWPSAPILRVVDPRARSAFGRLFRRSPVVADDRRIFTTATALSALATYCRASP